MRKYILLPLLSVIFLAGCIQNTMRFEPTVELKDKYDQSSKDSHITIYYNVVKSETESVLMMAVQNTGNIYMKNLTVNYDDCCQSQHSGPGVYNYKNLGNLKNRSHKTMSLKLPSSDVQTVRLKYSFTPVKEDSFLRAGGDTYASAQIAETIDSEIILYIGK